MNDEVAKSKNEDSPSIRYLSFSLGNEDYAIPLLTVKEVIAMPEVTPVPHTPPHFLGLMNLRGQVISILDLRNKLGIKPSQTSETAVIICDFTSMCLGVVVDSINSVVAPLTSEISERPELQNSKSNDYVTGVFRNDKKLILLLDLARTLNLDEQTFAKKAGKPLAA